MSNSHSRYIVIPTLLVIVGLASCASQPVQSNLKAAYFLHDAAFTDSNRIHIESRQDIFQLNETIRDYLDERAGVSQDTHTDGDFLANLIMQSMGDLSYNGNATTSAVQTFQNREANCLSMTILAFAMAKYLGFDVSFRYVEIPEYWLWREQSSLISRHVNLLLKPAKPEVPIDGFVFSRPIEIDFFAPGSSRRYGSHKISKETILAMFYNNKGAAALLAGKFDIAYAYLRAAALEDPALDMAISNLALLYVKTGHLEWAKVNYQAIIKRNPDNTVVAEGLAIVLRMQGDYKRADAIIARIKQMRENNPYYHYMLGEEAYAENNWKEAIHAFQKALDLRPDLEQAYFGLAKTYFQLGDIDWARHYLIKAKRNANLEEAKERYQRKLALLSH